MYDRSTRPLTQPSNSTMVHIGPGSYNPYRRRLKKGFAPFLSLSKRESFPTVMEQVAVAPGPGAYYSPPSAGVETNKGGASLQSKAKRFSSSSTDTPGPGTYMTPASSRLHKRQNSDNTFNSVNGCAAKLGHVTYIRKPVAPSIPFPGRSFGYEEDEYGDLKPQQIPDRDTTMGPAYYDALLMDPLSTRQYKGVHFGKLKETRSHFKGLEGPGPGDYTPILQNAGPSVAPQSSDALLPRYHEIVPQKELKKGVPGPGRYSLSSQFQQIEAPLDAAEPPPFGSSAQRFKTMVPCSPASSKYTDPRTALQLLKRTTGITRSAFGQSAARFKRDRNAHELPGPGAYNDTAITSMASDPTGQVKSAANTDTPFGSTSVRTVPLTKPDDKYLPGPASYQPPSNSSPEKHNAVFASSTKRLHSPPPIVTDIPPPGSYEVTVSYKKTHGKTDAIRPNPNAAFLSSNWRFSRPADTNTNETDPSNPGPTEYNPSVHEHKKGLICSRDIRFKNTSSTPLGPGCYELSKSQKNTVLIGTHNVTLNNPLAKDEEDEERRYHSGQRNTPAILLLT